MQVRRIVANIKVSDTEQAGIAIEYGPVDAPWGERRFYLRDPLGKLLNTAQHQS